MKKLNIKSLTTRINHSTGRPIVFDFFHATTFFLGFLFPWTALWGGYDSVLEWLPYVGLFPVCTATFVYGLDYWDFELKWHGLSVFSIGFFFHLLMLEQELTYKNIYLSFYFTCFSTLVFCATWYLLIFNERTKGDTDKIIS